MTQLTVDFSLEEFEASGTATRLQIPNRVPNDLMGYALKTAEMLQRIRNFLSRHMGVDVQIHLTSGYRCLLLNRQIGSKDTSDHVKAMAADWRAPRAGDPYTICKLLAPEIERLQIGQLINEYPDGNGWVHTSTRVPAKVINRVITITHAGTQAGVQKA